MISAEQRALWVRLGVSQPEDVKRKLRDALHRARGAGLDLIYGGPPIEYGQDDATVGISLLNALRPAGQRLGSYADLASAVADGLGVSECAAREIAYGWDAAPPAYPGYVLREWNALGWRLHCEFKPRAAS